MLLSRFWTATATAFVLPIFTQVLLAQETAMPDAPPASCQVTLPSQSPVRATRVGIGADGSVAAYGTNKLWTMLPVDGMWRGEIPQKPGDFAYSNKLPWGGIFSYHDGPLTVRGKRLDGRAPTFTEIEAISGKLGLMGGISIPVFGCWDITGQYKDEALRFVVWVTPIPDQKPTPVAVVQPLAPASAPRKVHVDGEVEAASLVYRVEPEIPHEAQVANVSGTVVLHAVIGIDGRPHDLQYVSGPTLLAQAAIDTVTWWQYRVNDENVEVDTKIPVVFQTNNN
jgi:hypothetical protein